MADFDIKTVCDLEAPMTDAQRQSCEVVLNIFGMWGQGKLHTGMGKEAWLEAVSEVWVSDFAADASGPSGAMFKSYKGMDGMWEWMTFFDTIGWPNLSMKIFPGPDGSNTVMMQGTADMQFPGPDMGENGPVEGTGGKTIDNLTNLFIWSIDLEQNKAKSFRPMWKDAPKMNKVFGDFTSAGVKA